MPRTATRIATFAIAATIAGIGLGARPTLAQADDLAEMQAKVEEANNAYDEAIANVEQIQGEIEENEQRIAQIEEKLPAQRQRAAESLKALYKMQQSSSGLLELILSADNFNDFISTISYLERIQNKNLVELQDLADMNAELQEAKDTLAARHSQANHEAEAARQAQQDAVAARDSVVQQALKQAQAEQVQAQQAVEQAQKEAASGKTFTSASGMETKVDVTRDTTPIAESIAETNTPAPSQPERTEEPAQTETEPEVPTNTARDQFESEWGARINAYLAGSPLAGYGENFAQAAMRYGVDPRLSPAISCVESGKGAICFKPHNAWGWGSSSWGSWEEAIEGHVAGLAAGGYYSLTMEGASRYCPPGGEWYAAVLGEMNAI